MKWKKLHKQKGHNPGGVYLSPGGIKCYVKFQVPMIRNYNEHLANLIYNALGIPVAQTQITKVNGRKAFVSQILSGKKYMSLDELKDHKDVIDGFLADAFMANFDVVGLKLRNIIKIKGRAYRIDNGGALFFYAKGEPKPMFEKRRNEAMEIRAMRNLKISKNPARVFHVITDDEVVKQSKTMQRILGDKMLRYLIEESGLPKKYREAYFVVLKARRDAIIRVGKELAA